MSQHIPVTVDGHGVKVTVYLDDGPREVTVVKVKRQSLEAGDWTVSPVGTTARVERVTHFKNHTRIKWFGQRQTFNHEWDTILIVPSFE